MAAAAGAPSASTESQLQVAIAASDAAVGVHQHHDALTGTDLEFVAENYANMIANASALVAPAAAAAAARLAGLPADGASACVEANVSVCPATAGLQQKRSVQAVLFNPLGSSRTEVVAVPVPVSGVEAVDATGAPCAADEPAMLGWPPAGPPWAVWLLLKVLVFYPAPLLPGHVEMPCSDG